MSGLQRAAGVVCACWPSGSTSVPRGWHNGDAARKPAVMGSLHQQQQSVCPGGRGQLHAPARWPAVGVPRRGSGPAAARQEQQGRRGGNGNPGIRIGRAPATAKVAPSLTPSSTLHVTAPTGDATSANSSPTAASAASAGRPRACGMAVGLV